MILKIPIIIKIRLSIIMIVMFNNLIIMMKRIQKILMLYGSNNLKNIRI